MYTVLQTMMRYCLIEANYVSKLFDVQSDLASPNRPGIRVTLDVYGLKIVARLKRRTALEGGRQETDHARGNPPHSGLCIWSHYCHVSGRATQAVPEMLPEPSVHPVPETLLETSTFTCAICASYIDPDLYNHHLLCHKLGWRGFTLEVLFPGLFNDMCQR